MQPLRFEEIGSSWQVEADVLTDAVSEEILSRVRQFDSVFSRFRKDSIVSRIAHTVGSVKVPTELTQLLAKYEVVRAVSQERISPTVGSALVALGYDEHYSLTGGHPEPAPRFNEALTIEDEETITLHQPVLIDLGALGKGYLIDEIAAILRARGATTWTINGGGDILHHGPQPMVVGLEHPANPQEIIGTVPIQSQAIAASSGNRRSWDRHHHLVDAVSGESVTNVVASWAICTDATSADLVATSLFFVDPDTLRSKIFFEGVVLFQDRVWRSPGFSGNLFTKTSP